MWGTSQLKNMKHLHLSPSFIFHLNIMCNNSVNQLVLHYLLDISTTPFGRNKCIMNGYSARHVKNRWREVKRREKKRGEERAVSLLVSMWQFKPGACLLCIWNQFEMWDYRDCLKDNQPTEDRKTLFLLASQAFFKVNLAECQATSWFVHLYTVYCVIVSPVCTESQGECIPFPFSCCHFLYFHFVCDMAKLHRYGRLSYIGWNNYKIYNNNFYCQLICRLFSQSILKLMSLSCLFRPTNSQRFPVT